MSIPKTVGENSSELCLTQLADDRSTSSGEASSSWLNGDPDTEDQSTFKPTTSLYHRLTLTAFLCFVLFPALLRHQVADPDIWWHLRVGQLVVSRGLIPHHDHFSFTARGGEWVDHVWLFQVISYLSYRAGSWQGLTMMTALLMTSTLFFLWKWLEIRRCGALSILTSLSLMGVALSVTSNERPQLWTYLGIVVVCWLLEGRRHPRPKRLRILPLVMLIWANLHGGCAIGILIIALEWIQLEWNARVERKPYISNTERILFTLAIISTLLNPYGWGIAVSTIQHLRDPLAHSFIAEWRPPSFEDAFTSNYLRGFIVATIIGLGLRQAKPTIRDLSMVVLTCFLALTSRRHIPLFLLFATPIVASSMSDLWRVGFPTIAPTINRQFFTQLQRALNKGQFRQFGIVSRVVLGAGAVVALLVLCENVIHPAQPILREKGLPEKAVTALLATAKPGRVLNYYTWGGYLIFRAGSEYPVYVDGRYPSVHSDDTIREYLAMAFGEPGWENSIDRIGASYVLWPAHSNTRLVRNLLDTGQWSILHEDNSAILLTRVK